MATIEQRTGRDGQQVYRVKVRRKGQLPQTATFAKLSEAKRWAQITEGAVVEGRHFPSTAARRHTVRDLIDRYLNDVLPSKCPSTAYKQRYRLQWWKAQFGHYALADVTPSLPIECRDKLTRNKARRQSGATVKRWLAVLSHCFTMAVRARGTGRNTNGSSSATLHFTQCVNHCQKTQRGTSGRCTQSAPNPYPGHTGSDGGPARQSPGGSLVFLFTDFQHDPLGCYKGFSIPLMILRSYWVFMHNVSAIVPPMTFLHGMLE